MQTRTMLIILGTGALLLSVVLATAGTTAWGWLGVIVLGSVTMLGAAVARSDNNVHGK